MDQSFCNKKREQIQITTVACPIIYGSVAIHLGKKAEEFSTHSWKLFIRGPNDEDLSTFVDRVAFTLHPSFAEPVRVIRAPPFEVSETGWGEFEASIRLYFKDPDQQPIDLFHLIKLYPANAPQQVGSIKKPSPVVAEQYDEVVFSDPSDKFYQQLMRYTANPSKIPKTSDDVTTAGPGSQSVFDDSLDIERLTSIQQHIMDEIEAAKVRLMHIQAQVVEAAQQRRHEQRVLSSSGAGAVAGGDGGSATGGEAAPEGGTGSAGANSRSVLGKAGSSSSSSSRPAKGSQLAQGSGTGTGTGASTAGAAALAGGAGGAGGPKRPRPAPKKPSATGAPAAGVANNSVPPTDSHL